MALLDDFKSASIWSKLAFILMSIALLFVYIAIACPGWAIFVNDSTQLRIVVGLWRYCSSNSLGCSQIDGTADDSLAATQAMVALGFAGTNVAFLLLILSVFNSQCKGNKECMLGAGILGILSGILLLIGCIIFGVDIEDILKSTLYSLGYAFGLGIAAAILDIATGVLLIISSCIGGGVSASA